MAASSNYILALNDYDIYLNTVYNYSSISDVNLTVDGWRQALIFFIKDTELTYVDYSTTKARWGLLYSKISLYFVGVNITGNIVL